MDVGEVAILYCIFTLMSLHASFVFLVMSQDATWEVLIKSSSVGSFFSSVSGGDSELSRNKTDLWICHFPRFQLWKDDVTIQKINSLILNSRVFERI